jgi:hypothetical protein
MSYIQESIDMINLPNDIKNIIKDYLNLLCTFNKCNNIVGVDSKYCSNICKSLDRRALLAEFLQANVITTMIGPCFKCPSCNLTVPIYRLDINNPRRLLLLIWNHITGACHDCINVNDLGYDLIDIGIILDEYN